MRIIGGRLKGLGLMPVPSGRRLRPTSARARTVLFDLLTHGPRGDLVTGSRVLELFAGTGSLSLEAVSRGAAHACLVENWPDACSVIERNIAKARVGEDVRLLRRDALRLGENPAESFDLLLLDPPYGAEVAGDAVSSALQGGWIGSGSIVACEASSALQMPGILLPLAERRTGSAWLVVAEVSAEIPMAEPTF
ncbi:MAG: RsmD family RNA methyltransferase [Rhodobacteraceae bacterium]|nr:RsmD family RNA methyltransferase [Paracoccaceae bacterium]